MKKLSEQQKKRQIWKAQRPFRISREPCSRLAKALRMIQEAHFQYTIISRKMIEVEAPEDFNLSRNHDEIINFLKLIRQLCNGDYKWIKIDFTTIKHLSPLSALLLTSEIHRWQLTRGALYVIDEERWDPVVKQLLYEMGFFTLVKTVNPPLVAARTKSDISFLQFRSDTQSLGAEAGELRREMEALTGPVASKFLLQEGLTEAMTNVCHWAYNDKVPIKYKRWWMSASYHKEENRMIVMFFDQGVGIPTTLPRSGIWEHVKKILASNDDIHLIQAAMQYGRTATKKENRGKGLKDIQAFILESPRGVLKVLSGFGEYQINHRGQEKTITHSVRLDGTLIAWEIYREGD